MEAENKTKKDAKYPLFNLKFEKLASDVDANQTKSERNEGRIRISRNSMPAQWQRGSTTGLNVRSSSAHRREFPIWNLLKIFVLSLLHRPPCYCRTFSIALVICILCHCIVAVQSDTPNVTQITIGQTTWWINKAKTKKNRNDTENIYEAAMGTMAISVRSPTACE